MRTSLSETPGGIKTFCFCFRFQEKTETETKQWSIRMIWLCFGVVFVRFQWAPVSVSFWFVYVHCAQSFRFCFSFGLASKTETYWWFSMKMATLFCLSFNYILAITICLGIYIWGIGPTAACYSLRNLCWFQEYKCKCPNI